MDSPEPHLPSGAFRYKRRAGINQKQRVEHREMLRAVRKGIRHLVMFVDATSASQKRYLFSALLCLIGAVVHFTPLVNDPHFLGVRYIGVVAWITSMAADSVRAYEKIKATTIGNWIIWGLGLALGNFLIVASAQEVASITGEDPSKFPHTVAVVALLEVPQLAIAALILLAVPWFAFGFFGLLHELSPDIRLLWQDRPEMPTRIEPYPNASKVIRFMSFTALLAYLFANQQHGIPGYDAWVRQQAEGFLYTFEMYTKSSCASVQGQHHLKIDDTRALIGEENKGVYTFKTASCQVEMPKKLSLNPVSIDERHEP